MSTTDPSAPTPPNPAPAGLRQEVVGLLKDAKEVIAALTAISVVLAFAFNYFATSKALECFKAESKRSDELVQTILGINELTAAWQLSNDKLDQLATRRKDPRVQADQTALDAVRKDFFETKARVDTLDIELKAARTRRIDLAKSDKPCA